MKKTEKITIQVIEREVEKDMKEKFRMSKITKRRIISLILTISIIVSLFTYAIAADSDYDGSYPHEGAYVGTVAEVPQIIPEDEPQYTEAPDPETELVHVVPPAEDAHQDDEASTDEDFVGIAPLSLNIISMVTVNDWALLSPGGVRIENLPNPVAMNDPFAFYLNFTVTPGPGGVISPGNYFRFFRPDIDGEGMFDFANISGNPLWALVDGVNTHVANWRIYNSGIYVEFITTLAGVSGFIQTGPEGTRSTARYGGTRDVVFNGERRPVTFAQHELARRETDHNKIAMSPSSDRIRWHMALHRGDVELGGFTPHRLPGTYGQNFTPTRIFAEDTLYGVFHSANFRTRIPYPVSLYPGSPDYGFSAQTSATFIDFDTHMTRIFPTYVICDYGDTCAVCMPNPDPVRHIIMRETQDSFRARIQQAPMRWGVWKNYHANCGPHCTYGHEDFWLETCSGTETFMAYFGYVGLDTPRMSELEANFHIRAAGTTITQGIYPESYRERLERYYWDMYGDDNDVGGRMVLVGVDIWEIFPRVDSATRRYNTQNVTRDGDTTYHRNHGTQSPDVGGARTLPADQARIRLFDEVTNQPLAGRQFQLQYQRADGSWHAVPGRPNVTTNEAGEALVDDLGHGVFRFRQVPGPTLPYLTTPPWYLPGSISFNTAANTVVSDPFTIDGDVRSGPIRTVYNIRRFNVTYEVYDADGVRNGPAVPPGLSAPTLSHRLHGETGVPRAAALATAPISGTRTIGGVSVLGTWTFHAGRPTTTPVSTFNGWRDYDAPPALTPNPGAGGNFTMPGRNVVFTGRWVFTPAQSRTVSYYPGPAANRPTSWSTLPPSSDHQVGAPGVPRSPTGLTPGPSANYRYIDGIRVPGTWTFNGWRDLHATPVMPDTGTGGSFTMPDRYVVFTGQWTFEADPYFYLRYIVYDANGVRGGSDVPASFNPAIPTPNPREVLAGDSVTRIANLTTNEIYRVVGGVTQIGRWTFSGYNPTTGNLYAGWRDSRTPAVLAPGGGGSFNMPSREVDFIGRWTFEAITPTINKEADRVTTSVGDVITYTITVTNPSAHAITGNFVISDPLDIRYVRLRPTTVTLNGTALDPTAFTWIPATGEFRVPLTSLPAEPDVTTLRFQVDVLPGAANNNIDNRATLVPPPPPANVLPPPPIQSELVRIPVGMPTLVKSASPDRTHHVGEVITYTITVTNPAPVIRTGIAALSADAAHFTIVDTLDVDFVRLLTNTVRLDGTLLTRATNAASVLPGEFYFNATTGVLRVPIDPLAIGETELTFDVRVLPAAAGETVRNRARMDTPPGVPGVPYTPWVDIPVYELPTIEKTSNRATSSVGDTITYAITVTNPSETRPIPRTFTIVDVLDLYHNVDGEYIRMINFLEDTVRWLDGTLLSRSTDPLSVSHGEFYFNASTGELRVPLNPVATGDTVLLFDVDVLPAAAGQTLINFATLQPPPPLPGPPGEPADPPIPPAVSDPPVEIPIGEPGITKTASTSYPNSVHVGEIITYTIRVTNPAYEERPLPNMARLSADYFTIVDVIDTQYVRLLTNTVRLGGTLLTRATNAVSVSPGEFYFNATTGVLRVPMPLDSLPVGGHVDLTFDVRTLPAAAGRTVINSASLEVPPGVPPVDDAPPVRTPVYELPTIEKEANRIVSAVGDTIRYAITVTNPSATRPIPRTFTIVDEIDVSLVTFQPGTIRLNNRLLLATEFDFNPATGVLEVALNPVAPGETVLTFEVYVLESAAGQMVNNIAVLEPPPPLPGPPSEPADPPIPPMEEPPEVNIPVPSLTKEANRVTSVVGDHITYTLRAYNPSENAIEAGFTIIDTIDTSLVRFVPNSVLLNGVPAPSGSYTFNLATSEFRVPLNPLASGETVVSFRVEVLPVAAGQVVTNVAILEMPPPPEPPPGEPPSEPIPPVETPPVEVPISDDPSIAKTANRSVSAVGDEITYTITAWNPSNEALEGDFTIVDMIDIPLVRFIPESVTLNGAALPASGFSFDPGTGRLEIPLSSLAPRATVVTFRVEVLPAAAGETITNVAVLEVPPSTPPVPPTPPVEIPVPNDPTIAKIANRVTSVVGDYITYTITAHNPSNEALVGEFAIVDMIDVSLVSFIETSVTLNGETLAPANFTFNADTGRLSIPLASLASGSTVVTFQVEVLPAAAGQVVRNVAVLETPPSTPEPPPTPPVEIPIPTITKTANRTTSVVADHITYTITATNPSETALLGEFVIVDVIDISLVSLIPGSITLNGFPLASGNFTFDAETGELRIPLSPLAPGDTVVTFRVEVLPAAAGQTVSNVAVLETPPSTPPPPPPPPVEIPISDDPSIAKTANRVTSVVGDHITYTLTAHNPNDHAIEGEFTIVDVIDVNLVSFIPGSVTLSGTPLSPDYFTFDETAGELRVTLDGLASGSTVLTFRVEVLPAAAGQVVRNVAVLEVPPSTPPPPPTPPVEIPISDDPSLAKTANRTTSVVGDHITYTLTAHNPNDRALEGEFVIVDVIDVNFVRLVSNSVTLNGSPLSSDDFTFNATTGVLRVPLSPLAPGSTVLTFRVEVLPAAAGQTVRNVAVLEVPPSTPEPPPTPPVEIPVSDDPSIAKTANRATSVVGDEITYTLTAHNPNDEALEGEFTIVDVIDVNLVRFIPDSVRLNGASTTDFTFDEATGELRVSLDGLASGSTVLTFRVEVLPAAAGQTVRNVGVLETPPSTPPVPPTPPVEIPVSDDPSIAKTANRVTSVVGDYITYTLTAHNPSAEALAGEFVIVDMIDVPLVRFIETSVTLNGEPLASANFTFNAETGRLSIPLDGLASGSTVVTFQVEVLPAAAGQMVRNVAVLETPPSTPPVPPTPPVEIPVPTVMKTANRTTSVVADHITYTITATNPSDTALLGDFAIVDVIDVDLVSFVPGSIMLNGFPLASGNFTFDAATGELRIPLSPLAPGNTVVTFQVEVLPAAAGQTVSNVAVLETPPTTPEPPPTPPVEVPISDDPSIAKTANRVTSVVGDHITYTLTAHNPNNDALEGEFVIVDVIDVDLVSFIPGSVTLSGSPLAPDYFTFDASTGELRVPIDGLASGSTVLTFRVEVLPAAAGQTVTNVGVLEPPPSTPPIPPTPPVEIPVSDDPSLAKTANRTTSVVGDHITYTLTAHNPNVDYLLGTFTIVDVIDVSMVRFVPGSITLNGSPLAAGNFTFNATTGELRVPLSPLAPSSTVLRFNVEVLPAAAGQTVRNVAVLEVPPSNPQPPPTPPVEIPVSDDPSIAKTANRVTSVVGDHITYTLTAHNPNDEALEGVFTIVDVIDVSLVQFIPDSIRLNGATLEPGYFTFNESTGRLTVPVDGLLPGSTVVTFSVEVLPAAAGQTVRNVGVLETPPSTPPVPPTPPVEIPVSDDPSIAKTANRTTSAVGDEITYTLTAHNPSPDNLLGTFAIVDVIDTDLVRFIPGSVTLNGEPLAEGDFTFNAETGELHVPLDGLASGSTVVTFRVEVLPAAAGQMVRNVGVLETPPSTPPVPPTPPVEIPVPTVEKTSNRTTSVVGDHITYTITATNPSETALLGTFTIVDVIDVSLVRFISNSVTLNGVTLPAGSFTFNAATGELRVPISSLAPGDTVVTFRVEVLPAAAGQTVTNVAVMETPPSTPEPPPTPPVEVPISDDPSIAKTANRATSVVGDEITYTLTAHNPNDEAIEGEFTIVDVIDTDLVRFIPESVRLNGATLEPGYFTFNAETGRLAVTLDGLAPGSTILTFRVEVLPEAAGQTVTNVGVLETPPNQPPVPPTPPVEIPVSDELSIAKAANRTSSAVGDEITYTITVHNPSDYAIPGEFAIVDMIDVSLVRFMPETLTLDGEPLGSGDFTFDAYTGELRITVDPLESGSTVARFRVEVLPVAAGQVVTNIAELETPPGVPPVLPTLPISIPIPTITKTANRTTSVVGDEITYTITATNPSDEVMIGDFAIVDMIDVSLVRLIPGSVTLNGAPLSPANFTFDPATGELRTQLVPFAPGDTVLRFRVEVLPAAAGLVVTNAAVLETPPSTPAPPPTPPVDVPVSEDPSIAKTANRVTSVVGDEITYTLTAHNPNTSAIVGDFAIVDVIDTSLVRFIPDSVRLNGAALESGRFTFNAATGELRVPINPLAPGSTVVTFRVEVLPAAAGQTVTNVGVLETPPNQPPVPPTPPVEIPVSGDPSIAKTANRTTSVVGDEITYTLTAHNPGDETIVGEFVIVDVIDTGLVSFIPGSVTLNGSTLAAGNFTFNAATGELRVPLDELPVGSTVVTFRVEVLPAAAGQMVRNVGVLETPPNVPPVPPTPPVEIPIPTVTKTSNRTTSVVGDHITYTITATNPSEYALLGTFTIVDMIDVSLVRLVPGSVMLNGSPLAVGNFTFNAATGELRIPLSPLASGNTVVSFRVEVLPAAAGQTVSNVAVLETPPSTPEPPPTPPVDVPISNDPSIAKSANRTTSVVGDEIMYTLTAHNPGTTAITGGFTIVDVIDTDLVRFIPESLRLNGAALTAGSFTFNAATGELRVPISSLPPGSTVLTFSVEVLPAAAGLTVTNVGVLETPPGVPPIPPTPPVEIPVSNDPSIAKTANRITSVVGDEITYTLTAHNPGEAIEGVFTIVDVIDVSLVRFIPESVTLNGSPLSAANFTFNATTGELRVPLDGLASGSTVLAFRVEVLPAAAGQMVSNVGVLETPPGVPPIPPTPPVDVPIPTVAKTSDRTTAEVGDEITYTITATNPSATALLGNFAIVDVIDVSLVRFIPESLTLNGAPLAAANFTFNATTGELRIPLSPLDSGDTVVTFRVEVLPAAAGQTVNNVAMLETPPGMPEPPPTPPVEVEVTPVRNIRIYYYLRDSNGGLNRDMEHNPYGRGYVRNIGSLFDTNHVLNRNGLNNGNVYVFEGWLVHVGTVQNDNYLNGFDRSELHDDFIVPAPANMGTVLTDFEIVGETIILTAIWRTATAGDDDDDDKRLPQTGIESSILLWSGLLLAALLTAAGAVVMIKEHRKNSIFRNINK